MKVQDFAFRISMRTIELLEEKQHYKVSEENRKEIAKTILLELNEIIKKSS